MFNNKNVLIAGGRGMIGRSLINLISEKYPQTNLTIVDISLKPGKHLFQKKTSYCNLNHIRANLTSFDVCQNLCDNQDYVFNLMGIKGSPKKVNEQPASSFVPVLQFNTNLMEAARLAGVVWYLYTSTIGVYHPAELLKEEDVWETFPSHNDWFGGWAKRMGELQAKAYEIQYGLKNISIVRPANVYGPHDNFNLETAMVIPSLINKFVNKMDPVEIWGDGSQIRDFVYMDDVARGMLFAVENQITEPVNLGSGLKTSIKNLVLLISSFVDHQGKIQWLKNKPTGDKIRLMNISKMKSYGFECTTEIVDGLTKTIKWYQDNEKSLS